MDGFCQVGKFFCQGEHGCLEGSQGRMQAQDDPEVFLRGGEQLPDASIEDLIARRLAARKAKEWAEADRIRDELKAQGVLLEDGPDGTTWRRT